MKIGELAKKTGLSIETIRYYEKQGLIEEPIRRENGYRDYHQGMVDKLLFVQRAKALGFSLNEIRELLDLSDQRRCHHEVHEVAEQRLADIQRRIKELARMRDGLHALVQSCQHEKELEKCPILAALLEGGVDDERK
ncbi:MerR family DNA-binding protein [Piscirickettsia salmonis]|uniref:MerR family DNA-binding protein n=1 Tax=Piscirickettsia salmonis TaxID=1238 RepID=UPI0007C88809|nr:Mercuric resistance operon regulatory protein [Piscirickettsiaceae bacterium NZ-RLO1]